MANTTTIRTTIFASDIADNRLLIINKMRKKAKKPTLSKSQIVELALINLTIEAGVDK